MKKFLLFLFAVFLFTGQAVAESLTLDFVNNDYGLTRESGNSQKYIDPGYSFQPVKEHPITITFGSQEKGNRLWTDGFRVYKNADLKISVSDNYVITETSIETAKPANITNFSINSTPLTQTNNKFTSNDGLKEVTISAGSAGNYAISKLTITYEEVGTPIPTDKPEKVEISAEGSTVTMSCPTENATIYYSIDNGAEQTYTEPFTVEKSCTITAYAKLGDQESEPTSKEITVGTVITPEAVEISTKEEPGKTFITLTCPTENATIYYSIDDNEEYKEYKAQFDVTESCKITAYAELNGEKGKKTSKEITVLPSSSEEQKTVTFDLTKNLGVKDGDQIQFVDSPVTVTAEKGGGSNFAQYTPFRFYSKNTMTFSVPKGYELTQVKITCNGDYTLSCSVNEGEVKGNGTGTVTWSPKSGESISEFTLTQTASSQSRISEISVSYVKKHVDPVVISYDEATNLVKLTAEEGAEIKYGYSESAVTNVYTEPFEPSEMPCTIYAIANKDGKYSDPSSLYITSVPDDVTISYTVGNKQAVVTISCPTEGAEIWYAVNSDKEGDFFKYEFTAENPLVITEKCTIYAYAIKNGVRSEQVIPQEIDPIIHPKEVKIEAPAKNYEAKVTLSCETETAKLFYSIDNEAAEEYTEYTDPFKVYDNCTVYAYSFNDDEKSKTKSLPIVLNKTNPVTVTFSELNLGTSSLNNIKIPGLDKKYEYAITCKTASASSSSYPRYVASEQVLRLYDKNTLTLKADEGYEITKVEFVPASTTISTNWDGRATSEEIVYTSTGQTSIQQLVISYQPVDKNRPADVVISEPVIKKGIPYVTLSCPTEGAEIRYGFSKETISELYKDEAIEIEFTGDIWALAINNGSKGFPVSKHIEVPTKFEKLEKAVDAVKNKPDQKGVYVVGKFTVIYKYHNENDENHYLFVTDGESNAVIYGCHDDYNVGDNISEIVATLSHNPETGMFRFTDAKLVEGDEGQETVNAPSTTIDEDNAETLNGLGLDNLFDLVVIEGCKIRDFNTPETVLGTIYLGDPEAENPDKVSIHNLFGIENIYNQNGAKVKGFVSKDKDNNILIIPTEIVPGTTIEMLPTPVFNSSSESILRKGAKIEISCDTANIENPYMVEIRYEISTEKENGALIEPADPTMESTLFVPETGIEMTADCIIKAKAFSTDTEIEILPSNVTTVQYELYDATKVEPITVTFDFTTCEDITMEDGSLLSDLAENNGAQDITTSKAKINSISKEGINIEFNQNTAGTSCRIWNHGDLRVYDGSNFTISSPDGYFIKEVKFNITKANEKNNALTYDGQDGTFTDKILWSAKNNKEVTSISFKGKSFIESITVTLVENLGYFVWMLDDKIIEDNNDADRILEKSIDAKPAGNDLSIVLVDGKGQPLMNEDGNYSYSIETPADAPINWDQNALSYTKAGSYELIPVIEYNGDMKVVMPSVLTLNINKSEIEFTLPEGNKHEIEHDLEPYDDEKGHLMTRYEIPLSLYSSYFDVEAEEESKNIIGVEVTPLFTPLWGETEEGREEAFHKANHYYWYADPIASIKHDKLYLDATVAGKYLIHLFVNEPYAELFSGEAFVNLDLKPTLDGGALYLAIPNDSSTEGSDLKIGYSVTADAFYVNNLQHDHLKNVQMYLPHKGTAWFKIEYKTATDVENKSMRAPALQADEETPSTGSDSKYPETPAIDVPEDYTLYKGKLNLQNADKLHILMNVNGTPLEHTASFVQTNDDPGVSTSVDEIDAEFDENAEYYTVEGIRVERPTAKGIYVKRSNGKSGLFIVR